MSDNLKILGISEVGSMSINLEKRLLLNPMMKKVKRFIEPHNPWRWKDIYRIYRPKRIVVYPIDLLKGVVVDYLA